MASGFFPGQREDTDSSSYIRDRLFSALDVFKETHHGVEIWNKGALVDITHVFSSKFPRGIVPPGIVRICEEREETPVVMAYISRGGPYVRKYGAAERYREDFVNDPTVICLASLCVGIPGVNGITNTSLSEVYDPLKEQVNELLNVEFTSTMPRRIRNASMQGWTADAVACGIKAIKYSCPDFDPTQDQAFIMGGDPNRKSYYRDALELNALWLVAMIKEGRDVLGTCTKREVALMRNVFPREVLAMDPIALTTQRYVRDTSYGKVEIPETEEFLKYKIRAMQKEA